MELKILTNHRVQITCDGVSLGRVSFHLDFYQCGFSMEFFDSLGLWLFFFDQNNARKKSIDLIKLNFQVKRLTNQNIMRVTCKRLFSMMTSFFQFSKNLSNNSGDAEKPFACHLCDLKMVLHNNKR